MTDLDKAYEALAAKARTYQTLWQYYDGDQPLVYSRERLREIFQNLDARFNENWCGVVVDSVWERIDLKTFQVAGNEQAGKRLNALWESTEMNLDDDEAIRAALVCPESFVIVWKRASEDGEGEEIEAYYNNPAQCHVVYEADNPKRPRFAAKTWIDEDDHQRITLYYRDRLEYYVSRPKAANVKNGKSFIPAETPSAENPYGVIPVFHLRKERRSDPKSELHNVIGPQDAINKLLADMMIAAEFGAFKQRYIISNAENLGQQKNAPNEIWDLPAGDGDGQGTQVGEFSATDLSNYLGAIDKRVATIAAITRTPKHYFTGQGGDPSGEALIAMEAPLNKKATKYIEKFTPTFRQIAAFMLRLDGVEVELTDITPVFEPVATVQPLTRAQIRQTNTGAGLPLESALKEEGKTDEEIAEVLKAKKAEEDAKPKPEPPMSGNGNGMPAPNGAPPARQPPTAPRTEAGPSRR